MKILSFDTSSNLDSCTLYDSEKGVLSEFRFTIPSHKSETIIKIIEFNLEMLKLKISDLDILAVCGGPGSFTGTRIGIATALGISKGANIKCCIVNILDILAYTLNEGRIVSFLANSNEDIYFADYTKENEKLIRRSEYLKYSIEDFIKFFQNNKALYISDKMHKFGNIYFDNILTKSTIIAKIVSKYKDEDFNNLLKTFYL